MKVTLGGRTFHVQTESDSRGMLRWVFTMNNVKYFPNTYEFYTASTAEKAGRQFLLSAYRKAASKIVDASPMLNMSYDAAIRFVCDDIAHADSQMVEIIKEKGEKLVAELRSKADFALA